MHPKMRELLDQINAAKIEVKALIDADKLDEAKEKKAALQEMQNKFDLMADLYDAPADQTHMLPVEPEVQPVDEPHDAIHEFAAAARGGFRPAYNADAEPSVTPNNETTAADGGYAVPEDIQTRINHFKEATFSMRSLVSVEKVRTNKGARTYQTKAQAAGFGKVLENGTISGLTRPQFTRVTYAVDDYAGYLPVTNDLLADSDANIAAVLIEWIGKNSQATDNKEILAILTGKTPTALTNLNGIKGAINVTLGQAYRPAVRIVTNDDGLNYLDTLQDAQYRPLLNPNPTEPNKIQLRVGATVVPIDVVPNSLLASTPVYSASADTSVVAGKTYYTRTGSGTSESPYVYTKVASPTGNPSTSSYYEVTAYQYPFICGDFKEAVRVFDREQTTILASDVASVTGYNAFEQRGRLYRAEIRADYVSVDSDAWVNGYIQVSL